MSATAAVTPSFALFRATFWREVKKRGECFLMSMELLSPYERGKYSGLRDLVGSVFVFYIDLDCNQRIQRDKKKVTARLP